MPLAARLTDFHECPMQTPAVPSPIPHVGGPITGPGEPTVLIEKLSAARVGDMLVCVGPHDTIIKGSSTVMIGGMPAARVGDTTAHGGSIVVGASTVMIGG
ncbi:putative Zn-binding protein involved in type VI secretion [Roseivirga ehrenbergii]|uniref:Type VI secretion protein n=1 Tax=Roseivirga ehrenbergii (strain DSM 102268 / JCM 13514 / KCTC 12282 / NCIMB 14502 / KMM 6017) TaxID=279360 RepID=A0A150X718_ROSEK|nr:PAAR domain-containing protein [Roseivirga ehrenbergii]KYG74486.1 type VI secretion protein [Roseivirga ehrenbergii]TCL14207.1 putative Zn-binding protein involved in type VI secretion [Roseivirga ehrenbergii]